MHTIADNDYIPVFACLVIGFILAYSLVRPGFQQITSPVSQGHNSAFIVREAISGPEHGSAPQHGEFLPLDSADDSYFATSKERDASLPTPELFVKTEALDDGYLLHLASNNFVVRADHLGSDKAGGYYILEQEGEKIAKLRDARYFITKEQAKKSITIILVDNKGNYIMKNGKTISEKIELK